MSRAQEIRHESDYNDFYIISVDDTKEQIETASEVYSLVEDYICKRIKGTNNN